MGFGLLVIGSALLLFETLGIDFIGYMTICYGCFLLSYHFRIIRVSCFASLAVSIASLIRSLTRFGLFTLGDTARAVLELIIYAGMAVTVLFICSAVSAFAGKNSGHKLKSFSDTVRYIASLFYLFSISLIIFANTSYAVGFTQFHFIYKYLLIVLYIIYFFYSYTSVTTPAMMKKEEAENLAYEEKEQNKKKKMRKLFGKEDESDDDKK